MSKRLKHAMVVAAIVFAVAMLVPFALHRIEAWAVGIHQKSTTIELAEWEQEFSQIRSDYEAHHAVDMLGYIQGYYVPGPGNTSDSDTEAALQAQRQKTLNAIANSLEEFTGERFGLDVEKWEAWRDGKRHQ
jgi:hypothetical protein